MKVHYAIVCCIAAVLLSYRLQAQESDSVQIYLDSAAAQPAAQVQAQLYGKAIGQAYLLNDANTIAKVYMAAADFEWKQGFYTVAVEHYLTAAGTFAQVNRTEKECEAMLGAIRCQSALGQWALVEANAQVVFSKTTEASAKAEANRWWAAALCKQGRTDEAIQRLNDAKKIAAERGDAEETARLELELGACYTQSQQLTLANDSYFNAANLSGTITNGTWSNTAHLNLANNYAVMGDYAAAQLVLQNVIENEPAQPIASKAALKFELGRTLMATNDLKRAEDAINEGYTALNQIGDTVYTLPADSTLRRDRLLRNGANAFKKLADEFARTGNEAKALKYYKRYAALQDSLTAALQRDLQSAVTLGGTLAETQARIQALELERERSNASILFLEDEKRIQSEQLFLRNAVIGALIVLFALLLGGSYWLWRTQRAKRKADQLLALQSLTGQMNPHFIFNALNSVNEFIARNDEREANRYLTSFSRLMRQVLDDSRRPFIAVQEEVHMLQLYLQLEHARFADKFQYTLEVDEAVHESEFEIPPMLVQPYVENAIWHGLRYRAEGGALKVNMRIEFEALVIEVSDNGVGIERSKALKTAQQQKQLSVGMSNTATRIALLNEVYTTRIEVHVVALTTDEAFPGTLVRIVIPKTPDAR